MDIRLTEQVKSAHEKIGALEKKFDDGFQPLESGIATAFLARIEKLEMEIRMLKARMGKQNAG